MSLHALSSQKYLAYSTCKYLPPRSTFWFISLYDELFSRYKDVEIWQNRKGTLWGRTDSEHLMVKSILHTLSTYPRGPNFGPFFSTTSHFKIQGCWKSELMEISKWPQIDYEVCDSQQYLTYTRYARGSNLCPFCSTTSHFRHTSCRKSETHWMTSKWPWTLNSQK